MLVSCAVRQHTPGGAVTCCCSCLIDSVELMSMHWMIYWIVAANLEPLLSMIVATIIGALEKMR